MLTIKGGPADKAGIKYEPNTDASTFSGKTPLDLEGEEVIDNPFDPIERAIERAKED